MVIVSSLDEEEPQAPVTPNIISSQLKRGTEDDVLPTQLERGVEPAKARLALELSTTMLVLVVAKAL